MQSYQRDCYDRKVIMKHRKVFRIMGEDAITAKEHVDCGEGSTEVIELSKYNELCRELEKCYSKIEDIAEEIPNGCVIYISPCERFIYFEQPYTQEDENLYDEYVGLGNVPKHLVEDVKAEWNEHTK